MDIAVVEKPRAKLFAPAQSPKGMKLTHRDLALLGHVARHRFLTSVQLAKLDGGSPQGVLRCLRALFDHGLLDRPKSQLATLLDEGPQPLVYAHAKPSPKQASRVSNVSSRTIGSNPRLSPLP